MKALERIDPFAEPRAQRRQVEDEPSQPHSPWLTTTELAVYLRYTGKHRLLSVYRFLKRKGINTVRRSPRCVLIARRDVDEALGAGRKRR